MAVNWCLNGFAELSIINTNFRIPEKTVKIFRLFTGSSCFPCSLRRKGAGALFGYVTANYGELTREQAERYGSVYCGICREIRLRSSQAAGLA